MSLNREALAAGAQVVVGAAAVVAAFAAMWAACEASNAVEATERSVAAQERSVAAQTQPLMTHVPLGDKLSRPVTIDLYPDPEDLDYEGQILLKPIEGITTGSDVLPRLLVSVPMRNVGPGVAEITSAWVFTTEIEHRARFRPRDLPPYVAPQQEFRLSAFLNVGYIDPEIPSFTARYRDFASQTCWETSIAAIRLPSGGAGAYTPTRSYSRRLARESC
jgi:hypothetical protein